MNKYFDAKQMEEFIDALDFTNMKYRDRADFLEVQFLRYANNDRHQGEDAEVAKLLVRKKEIGFLNDLRSINKKVQDLYIHAKEEFHNKVDSAPDAKLDIDTLSRVERDFKRYYRVKSEHGANIERIARDLQNRYGHLTTFTQPSFEAGRENLRELCGGDEENTGFINGVITSFIKYDAEEKEYIKASGFEEEVDNLAKRIRNVSAALNESFNVESLFAKSTIEVIGLNAKSNANKATSNNQDDEIAELTNFARKYFDFTEEELELLALYYPDLLKQLETLYKYSTYDANMLYQQMKKKVSYLIDAHTLVEQYDLTDEQLEYIYNLENLIGHKYGTVYYSSVRVAGLEVVAAALFASGKSVEFVACVLGNCCAEHCVGGIEDSNYGDENNKPGYLVRIEKYFENKDLNFSKLYANELMFDLCGSKDFLNSIEEYIDEYLEGINVVGIGTCQWTTVDRLSGLIKQYKIEMGIAEDETFDRNITFYEAAKAEADYIVIELEGDKYDYSKADEEVNKISFDEISYSNNEEEIKQGAGVFFEYYEKGEPDSEPDRGENAWIIYNVMEGEMP